MSVMIDGAEALLADRKAEVVDYRSILFKLFASNHASTYPFFGSERRLRSVNVVGGSVRPSPLCS